MTRPAMLVLVVLSGCQLVSVDLAGRPCKDGACTDRYICHPEINSCVPTIPIDCNDPEASCAWTTSTGDPCRPAGAFLPCAAGRTDCAAGCRTCQEDETWSECTDPECQLGELWSCAGCDHDCRELIANAEPACNGSQAPSTCDYVGACLRGAVDADGRRDNGCECRPADREICNGIDDDCNNAVDDGATCSGAAVCENGKCVPCTEDDPSHCGPSCLVCGDATVCDGGECVPCTENDPDHCGAGCQVCTGTNPACVGGACACIAGSCNDSHYCDDGTCRVCLDDDNAHCGAACLACAGEAPTCIDGACQCTAETCDDGRWCDQGTCRACDDAAHCGAACVECSQETPACVAGSCECVTGSCPAGQYCDNGTCSGCDCPTLFSTCVDQGDAFVCRCTAASCGAGGSCEEDATTCVYADNFDGATSMLTLCDSDITENSTWEWGKPPFIPCHSQPNCWVTGLGKYYNNCELSCVESRVLDLSGVTGRVDVRLSTLYQLQAGSDGITPLFLDHSGALVVLDPTDGWDVDTVKLLGTCSWEFHEWPAFGQYETSDAIGWTEIHFGTDQATHPGLFYDGFRWRVYLQSDVIATKLGWFMDDVEVRVTQVP